MLLFLNHEKEIYHFAYIVDVFYKNMSSKIFFLTLLRFKTHFRMSDLQAFFMAF